MGHAPIPTHQSFHETQKTLCWKTISELMKHAAIVYMQPVKTQAMLSAIKPTRPKMNERGWANG